MSARTENKSLKIFILIQTDLYLVKLFKGYSPHTAKNEHFGKENFLLHIRFDTQKGRRLKRFSLKKWCT